MSEGQARAKARRIGPVFGRGHKSGKYKGIHYRSSYELRFLTECERLGALPKPCWARITYQYDGVTKYYIPDFAMGDLIFEIKPESMKKYGPNPAKFRAARKWCKERGLRFVVIDERGLDMLSGWSTPGRKKLDALCQRIVEAML